MDGPVWKIRWVVHHHGLVEGGKSPTGWGMGVATALRQVGNHLRLGEQPGWVQSMLRRLFRHAQGRQTICDFDGRFMMTLDLAEHMQRRMFWMGYYNLRLVSLLDHLLEQGMTVVDVGANIGEISLVCANRVGSGGHVVALEPIAGIADELRLNIRRNGLQGVVHVHQQGLAGKIGRQAIYASCGQHDVNEVHQGLGSLHGTEGVDNRIGVVDITTLDELARRIGLSRLDFLKVDIEGGELPCLEGGIETLRRFLPVIAVEVQERSSLAAGYHSRQILELLSPLGYRFYRLETRRRLVRIDVQDLRDYQDVICFAGPVRALEVA